MLAHRCRSMLSSTTLKSFQSSFLKYQSTIARDNTLRPPQGEGALSDPEISTLVERISNLSLLQTAELVSALRKKLNITDMGVMASSAMTSGATSVDSKAAGEKKAAATPEKSEFNVKLEKVSTEGKVKVIKEIKNILPELNLVQAKKLVEEAPKVIKEKITKDQAAKIKELLEPLGAIVSIE